MCNKYIYELETEIENYIFENENKRDKFYEEILKVDNSITKNNIEFSDNKVLRYYLKFETDNDFNEVISKYYSISKQSKKKIECFETRLEIVKEISKDTYLNSNFEIELEFFNKINETRIKLLNEKTDIKNINMAMEEVFFNAN